MTVRQSGILAGKEGARSGGWCKRNKASLYSTGVQQVRSCQIDQGSGHARLAAALVHPNLADSAKNVARYMMVCGGVNNLGDAIFEHAGSMGKGDALRMDVAAHLALLHEQDDNPNVVICAVEGEFERTLNGCSARVTGQLSAEKGIQSAQACCQRRILTIGYSNRDEHASAHGMVGEKRGITQRPREGMGGVGMAGTVQDVI